MNYYDLTKSFRDDRANRYLARKAWERKQKAINIFLTLSISFISAVTIATGLILWIDVIA